MITQSGLAVLSRNRGLPVGADGGAAFQTRAGSTAF